IRYLYYACSVEGCSYRAVEIRAECDVLYSYQVRRVTNRLCDGLGIGAANRGVPEPDSKNSSGLCYCLPLLVAAVPGLCACTFDSGVRNDDRSLCDGQRVVDGLRRRMSKVQEHLLLFHPADHFATLVGEPAFIDSVGRASNIVVEEMGGRHHSE